MGDIDIRVATVEDRSDILELLRSAAAWLAKREIDNWQNWHEPPPHQVRWIDSGIGAGEFRMLESNGHAIGCLRIQDSDEMFWGPRSERAYYLHSLTTARSLAGQGIGRRVFDILESMAVRNGVELLRLDCAPDIGLRAYYESCGFQAVGETTVDDERLVLYERHVGSA